MRCVQWWGTRGVYPGGYSRGAIPHHGTSQVYSSAQFCSLLQKVCKPPTKLALFGESQPAGVTRQVSPGMRCVPQGVTYCQGWEVVKTVTCCNYCRILGPWQYLMARFHTPGYSFHTPGYSFHTPGYGLPAARVRVARCQGTGCPLPGTVSTLPGTASTLPEAASR